MSTENSVQSVRTLATHGESADHRLNLRTTQRPMRVVVAATAASALLVFTTTGLAQAATSKPSSPSTSASGAPPVGGGSPSEGAPAGGPGGGTVGRVLSVGDGSFELRTFGTTSVKVVESSDTTYYRGPTKESVSAVKQGEFVSVTGKKSGNTVAATKVTVGTPPRQSRKGKVEHPEGAPAAAG